MFRGCEISSLVALFCVAFQRQSVFRVGNYMISYTMGGDSPLLLRGAQERSSAEGAAAPSGQEKRTFG